MTAGVEVGNGATYIERRAALEREIVRLREAIERARIAAGAATGDESRAYARRLGDENDDLRRENAQLRDELLDARAKRKPRAEPADAVRDLLAAIEGFVRLFRG